jgi:acyl transferase domain-containing protein/acyl carrier protein
LEVVIFYEKQMLLITASIEYMESGGNFMAKAKIATRTKKSQRPEPTGEVKEALEISAGDTKKSPGKAFSGTKSEKKIPKTKVAVIQNKEIAIIGMACRFPGAQNYEEFWENLKQGKSNIGEIPPERWDWKKYWGDPQTENNKTNIKWGGFIDQVAAFDAEFFGLTAREAETMDPQQRMMLELSWSCFEDAGICPSRLSGEKIGVFTGIANLDYKELQEKEASAIATHYATGIAQSVIANRISYYFNFKGPSFPLDTACASALTAIHMAAQALQRGECNMALAGGVSLLLTPLRFICFSKVGILSPTGSCNAFDESADGTVRGEGAGVILLKPLDQAREDGDTIYGVIKGSAVNHSGKTYTLTYPNPEAQKGVIIDACRRGGVTPDSISYIETHGTGTPKGDPLEYNGLLAAFQNLAAQAGVKLGNHYCGLGAVKTNIGHLEAASGIAGVIKVLLALKYRQIPGIHNFKQLNHRISLHDSPFYIVKQLKEWNPPQGDFNQPVPRRAGVSAFGFAGTNAHVVIEEAPLGIRPSAPEQPFYLICLSAKTEAALRRREADLAGWLENEGQEYRLGDISATLLLGREHFEIRSVLVVGDIPELQAKLKQVLNDGEAEGYFKTGDSAEIPAPLLAEESGWAAIKKTLSDPEINPVEYHHQLSGLAEAYVKGYTPNWKELFLNRNNIRRIALPTYPFAKDRYWVPEPDSKLLTGEAFRSAIHPLLHQNTSDLAEQRFSSTFTGREFYLADHLVKGERILPGVAYLEMGRAAIEQAAAMSQPEKSQIRLRNIVWARPIVVSDQPVQVHIALYPEADRIAYEIYSRSDAAGADPVVHSQGIAEFNVGKAIPVLDLTALRAECGQTTLTALQLYEAFKTVGLDYGPAHRGLEQLYIGADQALAKLTLPESVTHTQDQFVLHPSLMDAALQATVGFGISVGQAASSGANSPIKLSLPFALSELEIYSNCSSSMWAHIRPSAENAPGDNLPKLDLDLCDDRGHLCVRLKGFLSRTSEGEAETGSLETLILAPAWKEQSVADEGILPDYAQHLVVLCEPDRIASEAITAALPKARCMVLQSARPEIEERFQEYAAWLFEEIQAILVNKPQGQTLIQILFPISDERQLFFGLTGLVKTVRLENPRLMGQLIGVEPGQDPETIIDLLRENGRSPFDNQIRYSAGKRLVAGWNDLQAFPATTKIPWKNRGVYLITGGAGGLGLIFAREIAQQVKGAIIILTGRSPLGEAKADKLKTMESGDVRFVYRQVDVTDQEAVTGLIQAIRREFGNLDGIIHAAGILEDNFIIKKAKEEFQAVLAPKVAGLVNLDQASQDQQLDFLICFSSLAGTMGNPGQADYSTGNAFMDAYAHYRNTLVAGGRRNGRTFSIDWPLWREGGMSVNPDTERMLEQSIGMAPMRTATGLEAFYLGLASDESRILVAEGNLAKLRSSIGMESNSAAITESKPKASGSDESLRIQTMNHLKRLVANAVGLSYERIQPEKHFDGYGIDSIVQLNIIRKLEKVTGDLPKTLLFEYSNIHELLDYLVDNHADQLRETLATAQPEKSRSNAPLSPYLHQKPRFLKSPGENQVVTKEETEAIAIIGVSGRYPRSQTLAELWEHLKAGDNCIVEVPNQRWNTSLAQAVFGKRTPYPFKKYYGGFLDPVDRFDHQLFEISRDQVLELPPEVRLFLEIVWETFEDAGYTRQALQDLQARYQTGVGVFVGAMYNQYPWSIPSFELALLSSNGTDWQIANRTSHFFNLNGPSIAVNSACSSSLTAIHLACESLRQKTCSMAIAGGVNLTLDPSKYEMLQRTKFLGSGDRSKSFGDGDGYIPGEGVGAVLLKPLSLALKDRDRIDAVIKSSFVNHSGGRQAYTAPDPKQQARLIVNSIRRSGIDPLTIGYVESAANGSELGDPIELRALSNAFTQYTQAKQYCALGSVKSNLGHLEAASGISQLSKVLLQLEHQILVPSLNANPRNPNLKLESTPFYLQETTCPWNPAKDPQTGAKLPRRSMINSFGAGGAYSNLIVEEYTGTSMQTPVVSSRREYLMTFSAKTQGSLMKYLQRMRDYLLKNESLAIGAVEQSLHKINHNLERRVALVVASLLELLEKITQLQEAEELADTGIYIAKDLMFNDCRIDPTSVQKALEKRDLRQLAQYWAAGADIDFKQLHDYEIPALKLPKYAFEHELRFTFADETGSDPIPRNRNHSMVPEVYVYNEPYLKDHTVYGERVLVGVTHVSLAINAFFEIFPQEKSMNLQRLNFIKPIVVKEDQQVEVAVEPVQSGALTELQVRYRYGSAESWDLTATGNLQKAVFEGGPIDIRRLIDSLAEYQPLEKLYTANPAVEFGESFKTISHLYTGKEMVLAQVDLRPNIRQENHRYLLHPLIINSAFLATAPFMEIRGEDEDGYVPFGIKDIRYQKTVGLEEGWLLLRLVKDSGEMILFDAELFNRDSQFVAGFSGCSLKRLRPVRQIDATAQLQQSSPDADYKSILNSTELSAKIQKYLLNKLAPNVPNRSRLANIESNFMDLGVESARLVAVVNEIATEARIDLYPTLLFEYPNIKELTEYLSTEYAGEFMRILGGAAEPNPNFGAVSETDGSYLPRLESESWQIIPVTAQRAASLKSNSGLDPVRADIAVIGMHGVFAEAEDIDQFWNNLCAKRELIKEIPPDHWDYRPWYDENTEAKDKTYCKWGSFIDDVDKFDADFFNITPREAEWMDPQLRLLLQSIYAAGEDSGYINRLRGTNTGVFVGVCSHDYADKIAEMNYPTDPYVGTGNAQTIIANRISFSFNFTGPSLAIDTACSSSLFALHYACNALRNQECNLAFVGGVNLLLSSAHYRYFSSIGALSPTGRCHTFDAAADGYVPGECVASILLKPLRQAEKDGDHIYAVIKGSAALHGGYTPSLTAPSVTGEENVILKAWENAGINPEAISYIEAHGTGTKLGDPIEIDSLKKAFKRFTQKEQFCAIGSAKANIGHTEGAAGIAGIIKVILQMNQRQIPALPRFKTLNPYIRLDESPLYINRELQEWKSPEGKPRLAGINSFGFAGTYAHVVIEEFLPNREKPASAVGLPKPALIILSARNETGLYKQAEQLLRAIQNERYFETDLERIAYTLQVAREPMEERLAMTAASLGELMLKLQSFLSGGETMDDYYRGQVKRNQEALAVFTADEDLPQLIEIWLAKGKYGKLLDLWAKGLSFEWNKLYPRNNKPEWITLPTYPFAKERYWLPEIEIKTKKPPTAMKIDQTALIHPLVHRNTSDFAGQRFTSTFSGQETFLTGESGRGKRILPGVAYLEMARVAVEQATASLREEKPRIKLEKVIWSRPITVSEASIRVQIGLYPEGDRIVYEIYGGPDGDGTEPYVYSQGTAALKPFQTAPVLNLAQLQSECSREELAAFGSNIKGPGVYRRLERLYIGTNQVLAKIIPPEGTTDARERFVLEPGLLDAVLQVSTGIMTDQLRSVSATDQYFLPLALEELEIFGDCNSPVWAVIRYSSGSAPTAEQVKLDIDLCDEQGRIWVRIKSLTAGILETEPATAAFGTLLLQPSWREARAGESVVSDYSLHRVILCEPDPLFWESFTAQLGQEKVSCQVLQSAGTDPGERFQSYAVDVFEAIRTLFANQPNDSILFQIVVFTRDERQLCAGLSGLLKTARLENPKLTGQLIAVEPGESPEAVIAKLKENSGNPRDSIIRYQNGIRHVPEWSELNIAEFMQQPWKERGIYLITGGAGGLGLIFAQEIIRQAADVTLILTGRSSLSEAKQAQLNKLEIPDNRIVYRQVDATDQEAVACLIKTIREEFGGLNGIIHAAGLLKDRFIIKKSQEEFLAVLAPKVSGLVNLDQASQDLSLDFFLLFSSVAGIIGNPGQADYAAANAFMDAYAHYRDSLVATGRRHGRTLSVNWPLWREGGMSVAPETEKLIRHNTGMVPLRAASGIQALYRGLTSGQPQALVMEGDLAKMKQILLTPTSTPSRPESASDQQPSLPVSDRGALREKTLYQLKALFAEVTKLKPGKIDSAEALENYGIDSIVINQLNQRLTGIFGDVSKTLFYQYQNLAALADYFIEEYPQVCLQWTGLGEQAQSTPEKTAASPRLDGDFPLLTKFKKGRKSKIPVSATADFREPIAIIGMSGRYPQAREINAYWENLKAGKDCIAEIPAERWPLEGFYHPDQDEAVAQGKSYCKWGGFIDGFAEFDPGFFNISPREVIGMDPQERLFIQACWEVLEDAGYTREQLERQCQRRVGVFAGITKTGFELYGPELKKQGEKTSLRTSFGSVANRISYLLNLQGPSMPIDTMCSSSLTAIHEACEYLYRGECEMSIAGGVNLYLHPSSYIDLCNLRMLSKDGKCKSFGAGSNGFVPGEGVGAVLLKRLSRALADEDHIYAVIRGTLINHGGKTNGYTVPNPNAQAELIRTALDKAGVDARTVSYIEAHGTGTELGDPIEITSLTQAFRKDTDDSGYCAIGSAKSNIGHLEAAAGIAGVAKVVLQMLAQKIAPSLHARKINPNIDFDGTPFLLQQELGEWRRPVVTINGVTREYPRLAGISSFGAGGANAHVIIEEYIPERERTPLAVTPQNPAIIVLSAKNNERLREQAQRLLTAVGEPRFSDGDLADIAYTLQVGREALEERLGILAASLKELADKLHGFLAGEETVEALYRGRTKGNKEAMAVFAADEELREAIDKWMQRGKYGKLMELWVKGLSFDWDRLYAVRKPGRISLPTYPFAKERFWIDGAETKKRGPNVEPLATPSAVSSPKSVPAEPAKIMKRSLRPPALQNEISSLMIVKPAGISLNPLPEARVTGSGPQTRLKEVKEPYVPLEMKLPLTRSIVATVTMSDTPNPKPHRTDFSVEALREELKISLAEVLRMRPEDIEADRQFIELGLDSISGVEWIQAVNRQYETSIPATRIYDYPTINQMTNYLLKELSEPQGKIVHLSQQSTSPISWKEILQQVQNGVINSEQAERIFTKNQN